jgi:hypothetical protein
MAIKAFLDTNLFLHFRPLHEVDWPALLKDQPVELLLAPIVVRELESHKDQHSSKKLRARARESVGRIAELLEEREEGPLREHVTLRLLTTEPLIDFREHRLSESIPDDQLIASMIQYRAERSGQSESIVLVSHDFLIRQKARRHSFGTIEPPEELRLPPTPTEDDRRLQELQKIASRRPQLRVSFKDGSDRLETAITPLGPLSNAEREEQLQRIRERHPLLDVPPPPGPGQDPGRWGLALENLNLTREQNAEHNAELEAFYDTHAQYIDQLHKYRQREALSFPLTIIVANEGTAPANDIDVEILCTSDVQLFEGDDESLKPPEAPSPPEPPQPLGGFGMMDSFFSPRFSDSAIDPDLFTHDDPFVSVELLEKGFRIAVQISKLKHTMQATLVPFVARFPLPDGVRPFSMDYSVNSEDLIENVVGRLHVIPKTITDRPGD